MQKEKIFEKLKTKYRFTIFNDDTLHEINTFYLSPLNIFVYGTFGLMIVSFFTALLLLYTPLSSLLPNYTDISLQRKIITNSQMLDSLETKVLEQNLYLSQVKNILQGKSPNDTFSEASVFQDTSVQVRNLNLKGSNLDSIIRTQIEQEEKTNLSVIENVKTSTSLKNLHFYTPVKGTVTSEFDVKSNHLGIDVVAGPNEAIMATLAGTVFMATWSLETGYVIGVQHDKDLISIYKHNSVLLKKVGDRVVAGESIAIIGNSGEVTTGPHLHFELWHKGVPLNPKSYVAF